MRRVGAMKMTTARQLWRGISATHTHPNTHTPAQTHVHAFAYTHTNTQVRVAHGSVGVGGEASSAAAVLCSRVMARLSGEQRLGHRVRA